MDLLDDLDFDFEEVIQHGDGSPGLDAAFMEGQMQMESSVEKRLESGQPLSSDEQHLDSFEDLDDAAFDLAMQHIPESFDRQIPSREQRWSPAPYMDNIVLEKDMQNAEEAVHQVQSREDHMKLSSDVGNFVPGKAPHFVEQGADVQTTHDEQYTDWMDDAVFEAVIDNDLRAAQMPEQPSMGLQQGSVPQQQIRDRGEVRYQGPMRESMEELKMQPWNDSTHAWAQAKDPDEDSLEAQALSEALQYAYKNGLTTDYLLNSFSITYLFGPLVQSTISMTNDDGVTDYSHLPDLDMPDGVVLDNSRTLTMTQSALRLIAEARNVQSEEAIQSLTEEVCNPNQFKPTKLELPILRTDNERDLNAFQQRCVSRSGTLLSSIKKQGLPLYPQNLEDGEGMHLSCKARAESEIMMKRTEEEKVCVTKESLTYLVSQLKDDFTPEDQIHYMAPKMEMITPPISPKLNPKHTAPAIDFSQFPIPLDDSSSLLSDNFHAIEDLLLEDHQDVWSADTSPIREFLKDELTILDKDAFLERPRHILEDFKVEVPLMLDRVSQRSPLVGTEAFNGFVKTNKAMDREFEKAVVFELPDEMSDGGLQEQLEHGAQIALKSIEQEQLQAIDAVGRVPVPVMDFLIPEPAWKRLCGRDRSRTSILKWIQAGKEQLFKPPSWPVDKAAESRMVWSPLCDGADKVNEKESIREGEFLLEKYLQIPLIHEVQTSLDCIHQRRRAVVLEEDDLDEDIEMQSGIKKPEVDLLKSTRKRPMNTDLGATPMRIRRHSIEQEPLDQTREHTGHSLLPGDSPGAAGKLLANFMEIHAPKKRVLTQSKYFSSKQSDTTPPTVPSLCLTKKDHTQILEALKAGFKAPCPTIDQPATALTVFISITIPRRMIPALESLVPGLTLLERDYDAYNTSDWKPGSIVRTEIVPPLADDADITVSPSTGLIITSMIRVRQIPRAGTNKSMAQIRVEKASLRYERLVVLVGGDGGKEDAVQVMSSSDSSALLELQGFASGLECNVQVQYVGGGEKTLANWVAFYICRYGLADPQIVAGLVEPETLWEVFLRRAGFNVFAAQVVVSHLKPPSDDTSAQNSAQYGLGAFMTMTRGERMRRFGQLVGASTMERISRNVDEPWNRG